MRIFTKLAVVAFLFASAATVCAQETKVTLNVKTPGTLPQLIGDENKSRIEDLTVSGKLNGTDIKYLREMAGIDSLGSPVTGNSLKVLDLTNAGIVEGGESYYIPYTTQNDTVGEFMFGDVPQLTSLKIPASTRAINWSAIENCTSLTEFSVPDSVIYIGEAAFEGSTNIKKITLGKKVEVIDGSAFQECSGLKEINLPASLKELRRYAFYGCTSLKAISIPDGVEEIGNTAFSRATSLTDVTIGKGVKAIRSDAFSGCTSLVSIVVPDNVMEVGDDVFDGCKALKNVTLSANLKALSYSMFSNCTSLEHITLPETLEEIGEMVFCYDKALLEINVPDGVKKIGANAFFGCNSMTEANLGKGIETIGDMAFKNCDALKAINIDPENQTYASVDGALTDKAGKTLIFVPGGHGADYTVPETVDSIADGAFIWNATLKTVVIPDGVKSIGDEAFSSCEELEKVTLGSGIETIGEDAFFSDDKLSEIHSRMTTPPALTDKYVFYSVDMNTCKLYVPVESIEAYKAAEVWKDFANIEAETPSSVHTGEVANAQPLTINGRTVASWTGHTTVLTADGRTVYSGHNADITLNVPGLYLIKTGIKTVKMVIR